MKVSVIIPIYNTQKYLVRCFDSIINQTQSDLEIILVDDGSTDDSGRICDAYAEKDKRFRVLHKANGGVSSARNSGIDMMSGNYCCFVDSDDYISENYIAVLLNNIKSYCSDISVCGLSRTDTAGNSNRVTVLNRREAQLSLFNEANGIRGYIGGKLFKTDIIKQKNIKFDENQALAEDLLTVLRIMANYDEKTRSKSYKKFLLKNLMPYLFSKNFSTRKKIGAVAVLVCPKKLFERRRTNE